MIKCRNEVDRKVEGNMNSAFLKGVSVQDSDLYLLLGQVSKEYLVEKEYSLTI